MRRKAIKTVRDRSRIVRQSVWRYPALRRARAGGVAGALAYEMRAAAHSTVRVSSAGCRSMGPRTGVQLTCRQGHVPAHMRRDGTKGTTTMLILDTILLASITGPEREREPSMSNGGR